MTNHLHKDKPCPKNFHFILMNDAISTTQNKYSSKATLKIGASFITAVLLIALVLVTTFWAFKQIETAAEA